MSWDASRVYGVSTTFEIQVKGSEVTWAAGNQRKKPSQRNDATAARFAENQFPGVTSVVKQHRNVLPRRGSTIKVAAPSFALVFPRRTGAYTPWGAIPQVHMHREGGPRIP